MSTLVTAMIGILASLFLLMALGYICRKVGIINDTVSLGLSNLLVKVTLPCTILMSLQRAFSPELLSESLIVLVISAAVNFTGLGLAAVLAKLCKTDPKEKNIWLFSLTFANVGYLGYPLINAVYGGDGLIYTTMVNVTFNIMVYTLGVKLFTPGKTSARKLLLNPALIATAIGFALFLTSSRLPGFLADAVQFSANMTTPLSMLIVGSVLAKSELRKIFTGGKIYLLIAARTIVLPCAALLAIRPFIHNQVMLGVMVLLSGTAVGSICAIFATQYNSNAELASKVIFLSTIFSLVTIPFITFLLS